jgi:hypothetical protein
VVDKSGFEQRFLSSPVVRFFDCAIELLSVLFNFVKMKSYIVAALAAFASTVTAADGVKGAAEGFAKGIQDITTYTKSRY